MLGLFAVLPSYQSKGIGGKLVRAALSHIKDEWKCERCVIWVLENRPELLKWYEKMGFRWNGETRPFVFPDLLMERAEFRVLELAL